MQAGDRWEMVSVGGLERGLLGADTVSFLFFFSSSPLFNMHHFSIESRHTECRISIWNMKWNMEYETGYALRGLTD